MIKEFGLIRHAEKQPVGVKREPLEKSDLSEAQKQKWRDAMGRLKLTEPEIAYTALPKIEKLAQEMYAELPDKGLVIFTSSHLPRTKMTADLLACELVRLAHAGKKDIEVAFLWEANNEKGSMSGVAKDMPEIMPAMREIQRLDESDDQSLSEYLAAEDVGSLKS